MAERSFTKQVQLLRLGLGEEFRGEGILAVTKALLQSGVAYVGGYQGAPISHLMDVLTDAEDILTELGVHFEASASEAAAAAMLAASINYPLRGAVTWKSTVGTNVASDALSNLASAGVKGGALIILGEDYGEGASIMQERTHAFAMKSQIWLLDPRPQLDSIVAAVEQGFELSEASNSPVMLMLRIRACHVYGRFVAKDNRRPAFTTAQALAHPQRDYGRIILPPSTYAQEREKIENRLPAAERFIVQRKLNEMLPGTIEDVGIVLQGGLYNNALRALELLGLADVMGTSRLPLYVLNVTYPLVAAEWQRFCKDKRAVLVIEEGQPNYIEQAAGSILRPVDLAVRIVGKEVLPTHGEYTVDVLRAGIRNFTERWAPGARPAAAVPAALPQMSPSVTERLAALVPPRPPGLCTGCPERPFFAAMKLLQRETGPLHISADIGCHSFATLPPFNMGNSIMGYGLGAAAASAFNGAGGGHRAVAIMGDGGFWHNGLTSGIGNSVFNKHDDVTVIVDNGYSAATGGQDIPSSRSANTRRQANNSIVDAVRGVGIKWVKRTRTYDMRQTLRILRAALRTDFKGPKVIVAEGECQLTRQRRIRPANRAAIDRGERVLTQRFGVDPETCTGDHSCIRLSGCPSLTIRKSVDPLREDPVAHVDETCVGCGVCGEIADAAVLCPSFYRADLIFNASRWDSLLCRLRTAVIGFLQRSSEQRLSRDAL
ncbi:MAG TPA: indolepyruvate ferredoxin oxidoreductase subunit alpha [Steroidobacteraceae bacterium]|nr:indolepyruvate ferredoxin oxidoreductase subunit alpha [Steroidobacteraceae bacterium]